MTATPALTLAEAKRLLPIPALWSLLKLGEAPRVGVKFRSPFRPDRSPSCLLYTGRDGEVRFADKSRGVDADPVALLALASGLSNREACRRFLALASGEATSETAFSTRATETPRVSRVSKGKLALPADLHRGTVSELTAVASSRGLPLAGLGLASARGLLFFGKVCGFSSWLVTDRTRTLAQARRTDGNSFPVFRAVAERKAHTLRFSRQCWPLGIGEAEPFPNVLLVEGGPDLLAAHHFIAQANRAAELGVVAILGAGNAIPDDSLPLFAGKRVRIYPHADWAGREAAHKWAKQLLAAGASEVSAFRFCGLFLSSGEPVSDLNDLARMDGVWQPEGLLPK